MKHTLMFLRSVEHLPKLESLVDECQYIQSKGKLYPLIFDIRSEQSIKRAIRTISKRTSQVDVLINNAGIRLECNIEKMPISAWLETINTNLNGHFMMIKYSLPLLKKSERPIIVNISSIRGLFGGEKLAGYCASKFGVIGLTQSLAEEYLKSKLKIYSICPAAINTEVNRNKNIGIPEKKLIHPEDISMIIFKLVQNPTNPSGETIVILGRQKSMLRRMSYNKKYNVIQWE